MSQTRELFASRLGFILMTAGCAIGLGNVWRFPYIVGKYGGGLFVLIYLLFLIIFGLPVLLMELAIGRAARSTFPGSFRALQNPQSPFKWQMPSYIFFFLLRLSQLYHTITPVISAMASSTSSSKSSFLEMLSKSMASKRSLKSTLSHSYSSRV